MDKRYQIFISSTYTDLIEERDKAMHAVLKLKCFPVGMELFPAIDRKQFDHIKSVIDECDYYLLIIGARYGSMDNKGVSYTEKEYNYAVRKGIPVVAFLHSDINSVPLGKTDGDIVIREKLEKFRKKVTKGRLVNFWKNADELETKVISSLIDVFETLPRTGWVKSASGDNGDQQKEIDRLNNEIAQHLKQIQKLEIDLNDYHALELNYQDAQQKIELLNKQIKESKSKLETSNTTSVKSQSNIETFTVNGVSFKMVHVEGGSFMMGANDNDENANDDEKPNHVVSLSDYWIGETQVTQALWEAVMGNNPSKFKGDLSRPVECVSWNDCQVFIQELNKLTGIMFRLPTEAQWEFAARGGNKGKDACCLYADSYYVANVAWCKENSKGKTHPVGKLHPNQLGLYDMSGNVWEWCEDKYSEKYYKKSPTNDPMGPKLIIWGSANRVRRGGSWNAIAEKCRLSHRSGIHPSSTFSTCGLRLSL